MDEETLNPLTSEEGNNGDQPMPDLPDQDLSSSDSDSDSDSGSENGDDQAHQNLQLQTLEAELSANPGNYDTHVQVSIHLCQYSGSFLIFSNGLCIVVRIPSVWLPRKI